MSCCLQINRKGWRVQMIFSQWRQAGLSSRWLSSKKNKQTMASSPIMAMMSASALFDRRKIDLKDKETVMQTENRRQCMCRVQRVVVHWWQHRLCCGPWTVHRNPLHHSPVSYQHESSSPASHVWYHPITSNEKELHSLAEKEHFNAFNPLYWNWNLASYFFCLMTLILSVKIKSIIVPFSIRACPKLLTFKSP